MHFRRIVANYVEHRVRIGDLYRSPSIREGSELVHGETSGAALSRGLLVRVGPPTVVGHGLAAEVTLARLEVGIVDEDDSHLAAEILALEVVPVALGRADAVA